MKYIKYPEYIQEMLDAKQELADYLWLRSNEVEEEEYNEVMSRIEKLEIDIDEECYIFDKENGIV